MVGTQKNSIYQWTFFHPNKHINVFISIRQYFMLHFDILVYSHNNSQTIYFIFETAFCICNFHACWNNENIVDILYS